MTRKHINEMPKSYWPKLSRNRFDLGLVILDLSQIDLSLSQNEISKSGWK